MRTPHGFQCIKTLRGMLPIITILDFANEISLTHSLYMQIYVMLRTI